MAAVPFELRSLPDAKKTERWFLIQLPLRTKSCEAVSVPTTIGAVEGGIIEALVPVLDQMVEPSEIGAGGAGGLLGADRTVPLSEEQAIRLGLVFNIVSGRFSNDKVGALLGVVNRLPLDEVSFWQSRLSSDNEMADTYRKMFLGLVP